MGTMHPQELLKQWELEKIPMERATGYSLQNLVKIQQAIDTINITLYNLRADVDSLIAHTRMKPNAKGHPSKAKLLSLNNQDYQPKKPAKSRPLRRSFYLNPLKAFKQFSP